MPFRARPSLVTTSPVAVRRRLFVGCRRPSQTLSEYPLAMHSVSSSTRSDLDLEGSSIDTQTRSCGGPATDGARWRREHPTVDDEPLAHGTDGIPADSAAEFGRSPSTFLPRKPKKGASGCWPLQRFVRHACVPDVCRRIAETIFPDGNGRNFP